ncbi:MAG TPA: heavy-metal-associated domain-containing protein [Pirellulaceae bacterium]|jgi:copper chaperone CopZ
MTRRTFISAAAAASMLALTICAESPAASPAVTYTTIYVQDMHCGECAKTIARKLYAIPGVVEVRADVAKNIAYVVPQKDKTVPSKACWEAVESAGFRVVKLDSPQGSFTTKPR